MAGITYKEDAVDEIAYDMRPSTTGLVDKQ